MSSAFAQVAATGPLSLVQDLGRSGAAAMGLSPSGALDRRSLLLANRLLRNAAGAAGLEILLGGLRLDITAGAWVAVTGARGLVLLNGKPCPLNTALFAAAGSVLEFRVPDAGLRYYLGTAGGLAAPLLSGSASSDLLSGMGPGPLRVHDVLAKHPARTPACPGAAGATAAAAGPPTVKDPPHPGRALALRITDGPRRNLFTTSAWRTLTGQEWEISPDSNRIGARLLGTALAQREGAGAQLPSEGMVTGALQVPPSGLPTIFLADHPVTGGYPVIAVVRRSDLDAVGQAGPGQRIRFLAPPR
ncbi:biotin-dependent carboxyltransferase family protein [Paeniglutamicibacter antarcticus]|uniref:Biotin-dependent carboxyltransferase family protein n=1 Tax=Arthrobacter terrae TaxID=2935737 RepID=A0A931CNU0_9MICC|nr:biotin-dependent carboxyltransferase family protein [Arthrobacter terrae]MBG0739920.1 biotin-dependent carboxyltransferase family protein [Arthrobacter terrae]